MVAFENIEFEIADADAATLAGSVISAPWIDEAIYEPEARIRREERDAPRLFVG
jgi:hypothetical protein